MKRENANNLSSDTILYCLPYIMKLMAENMGIINNLKNVIKTSPQGKKYRAKKRVHNLVDRYMLSADDVKLGEEHPEKRAELVEKQRSLWPERWNEQNERVNWLASSLLYKGKEDINALRSDMLFCYFAYGFSPSEFLAYGLKNKTFEERRKYISDRESVIYAYKLNDIDTVRLFMDKNKTYEVLKDYFHRDAISITQQNDYNKYVDFVVRHPVFVKKSATESCGRGIELVDTNGFSQDQIKLLFDSYIAEGNVILEEKIVQSSEMARINESTVNTVRCLTLTCANDVIVPWCFGKLGRKGYFVDNGQAGGLLAGIDVDTGRIIPNGCCDEFGQRYDVHPDNGLKLSEFVYPDWEQMIELCKEAARQIPEARWIGWDTAHTENGWVIVEGNSVTEVIGPQSTWQMGIKETFDKHIADIKTIF